MASLTLFTISLFATAFLIGSEAQQTFQFSSFSQIPQSLLNQLSSDQVQQLKKTLSGGGGGGGNGGGGSPGGIQTFKIPGGSGGGSPSGPTQTLQFSSFSQIPQSLLNQLSSDQIQKLKQTLNPPAPQQPQQPQSPSGGQPSTQTFTFSSFSQIPQSLLDQLSSQQIQNLKQTLTPSPPIMLPAQPGQTQTQTFEFSSFSQIPQSLLDQLSSQQIENLKRTLTPSPPIMIPGTPGTGGTLTFSIPGGDDKQVNNLLNTMLNYIAAGGYLTGVPPIDLLLLRFYLNEGPQNFCS